MEKKIFLLIALLICVFAFSQNTRVIYKQGIYGKNVDSLKVDRVKYKDLTNEQITFLEKQLKNQFETEFELLFNNDSSVFAKKNVLVSDNESIPSIPIDNNIYYKSNSEKEKFYSMDIMGEKFLVQLSFDQYKWEISKESKTINGFVCYKATTTYKDLYNPIKQNQLTFNPIVWFTPSIPSSYGPKGFDGLPGLVLEASLNGNKYFYATKIEFDAKDVKIEKPNTGKKITQEELEKIFIENYKKMKNN